MGLTVTNLLDPPGPFPFGDRWMTFRKVAFDSSYPTGGEALSAAQLGFSKTPDWVEIDPKGGYVFEYDLANAKVKVLAPVKKYTVTFDPASLAAITSRDDAITVTGVAATDLCIWAIPPDATLASVVVQNARVSGLNTITVRLTNPSAGAVDVLTGTWTFYVVKANGAMQEVPDTTDLSALTSVIVKAMGQWAA